MALPDKIADFTVLPLLYNKSTQHILYIRNHVSKPPRGKATSNPFPNGRTLFVVNIPPDATERELALFFKSCGPVERVDIQRDEWSLETYGPLVNNEDEDEDEDEDEEMAEAPKEAAVTEDEDGSHPRKKRKLLRKMKRDKSSPPQVIPLPQPELPLRRFHHTGSSAHVVFTDVVSISRALSLASASSDRRIWPPTGGAIAPSGLAHYAALYKTQRPLLQDVKVHADTYMEVYEYNKTLTKQKSQYKKGDAIVDEDGFTLVTRGGAYGTTLGGGVGVASKQFMKEVDEGGKVTSGKRGKKKPKKHEKDNFYKFQIHEKRRNEYVDLKAKFEKDKEEISKLRASRKYKPY